ncbi:MAG: hypothetical protein HY823_04830 [Acidobacteria bacterium]|nr:hypothetical protein [Acidobacteriota bacterium]
MRSSLVPLFLLAALLAACTPLVTTHTPRRAPLVLSDCVREGPELRVKLSLSYPPEEASWEVEVEGETPDQLKVDQAPGLTRISWRLDPKRRRQVWTDPYRIRIRRGGEVHPGLVSIHTPTSQLLVDLFFHGALRF